MKHRKIIISIYLFATCALSAASINFDSTDSIWEDSFGFPLSDGSQILIGNFNTTGGFNFDLIGTPSFDTYSEVLPFFTQYGSGVTKTVNTFSGIQQGDSGVSTDTGSQIYFWAFNDSDLPSATEWAIVGNSAPDWFVPSDPTPGITSINLGVSTETRFIEFGTESSNLGPTGSELNVQTGLIVPEPSTYALIAGIFTLGYIIIRRSRA